MFLPVAQTSAPAKPIETFLELIRSLEHNSNWPEPMALKGAPGMGPLDSSIIAQVLKASVCYLPIVLSLTYSNNLPSKVGYQFASAASSVEYCMQFLVKPSRTCILHEDVLPRLPLPNDDVHGRQSAHDASHDQQEDGLVRAPLLLDAAVPVNLRERGLGAQARLARVEPPSRTRTSPAERRPPPPPGGRRTCPSRRSSGAEEVGADERRLRALDPQGTAPAVVGQDRVDLPVAVARARLAPRVDPDLAGVGVARRPEAEAVRPRAVGGDAPRVRAARLARRGGLLRVRRPPPLPRHEAALGV
ncbi:hypothetical protein THAOC_06743, partial [Thalassiosira oceanica]